MLNFLLIQRRKFVFRFRTFFIKEFIHKIGFDNLLNQYFGADNRKIHSVSSVIEQLIYQNIAGYHRDEQQHFLFELIERRHDCSSTIFCTQFKKDEWHARLGGGVHADAMMDRIVHNAIWVFSGTLNMRKYLANVNNPFES